MNNRIKFASVAIVGLLIVGCSKSDNTPAANNAAGASAAASDMGSSASSALSGAIDSAKQKASDIGASASNMGSSAAASVSNAVDSAKQKASDMAASASNMGTSATGAASNMGTSAAAPGASSSMLDTAKGKLQEVQDAISNGKLDQADSALKTLEGMKSSLPDSVQQQITTLRSKLDSLKSAAGGMNMPSMPGSK